MTKEKTHKRIGKRNHNSQTRGLNKYGREPLGFNPELLEKHHLPEAYEDLKLDWVHEISYYAAENRYKALKIQASNGSWNYVLEDRRGNHILTVNSAQDLMVASKRKKKNED